MTLSELLEPELRLFLSVDVQDSTAFKQQADATDALQWRPYFGTFYREFTDLVEEKFPPSNRAQVWKLLGDEVVFSLRLHAPAEVAVALRNFRDAVANFEPNVPKPRKLQLKGSAWIADFPAGNLKVPDPSKGPDKYDYIGPSMDTGFRLGKIATRRKLALSVELAWLLLQTPASLRRDLPLHFDGRCQLKGVMEREGYPFIWTCLDFPTSNELDLAEDQLRPPPKGSRQILERFCRQYIERHGEPRWLPFILGGIDRRTPLQKQRYNDELAKVNEQTLQIWPELSVSVDHERVRAKRTAIEQDLKREFERFINSIQVD